MGYNLLVFVYEKIDNAKTKTTTLHFVSCAFISSERTADYTTTYRLREMIKDNANEDDIIAYLTDRNIPADEITLQSTAKMILENPPKQGYLTISNALQWRLQYQRVVSLEELYKILLILPIVSYLREILLQILIFQRKSA